MPLSYENKYKSQISNFIFNKNKNIFNKNKNGCI